MKYDINAFNKAVRDYKKQLQGLKEKSFLVLLTAKDEKAFFSIAPLSQAFHELNKDINITVSDDKNVLKNTNKVWDAYSALKKGIKNEKTKALKEFIDAAKSRMQDKKDREYFESIFEKPVVIQAGKNGFESKVLKYDKKWFKEHKSGELRETCRKILRQCYNIKRNERASLGFELLPRKKERELPIEDYLDNFAIIWAMLREAKKITKNITMGSASPRFKMLDYGEKIGELKATLIGCELSKNIDTKIFKLYKKVSKLLKIKIKFSGLSFSIHGKGYGGKHVFGETIGYPSPNKKTKWTTPGGIIYKLDWAPQSKIDKRDPIARVGFTETLPIDVFIQSCNLDYHDIWARNKKISGIAEKCNLIFVKGEKTNLTVHLKKKDGSKRWFRASDSDARYKINPEFYKRTKVKTGMFANFPGGEAFVTPEYIEGVFCGDVVISIDQSYRINEKNPIIVKCGRKGYKILSCEKNLWKKLKEKKKEAWNVLCEEEKHKSLPIEIIRTKKKNFNNIGEFAINTNPEARLCNYLIVNEKIAKMIHIALGSGFEPDKASGYHYDIVINAEKQKLDIFGFDKNKKELWIMRKGKLVV